MVVAGAGIEPAKFEFMRLNGIANPPCIILSDRDIYETKLIS